MCRQRPIRKRWWLQVIFVSLNRVWPIGGCWGRGRSCVCRRGAVVSIQRRRLGRDLIPWVCLCWRLGWLASNKRGHCLRSGVLHRWVFGSKWGRWRGWWLCTAFFICCWRSDWVCRWRGRDWWLVRGGVGFEYSFSWLSNNIITCSIPLIGFSMFIKR